MKKIIIVLFVIFSFLLSVNSLEKPPRFRLYTNFYSCPLLYEYSHYLYGGALNGTFMGGVRLDKFTVGAQLELNYFSIKGQETEKNIFGAENIIRGSVVGYYKPVNWFEFKWGIGGSWISTSMNFQNKGILNTYNGGVSILADAIFYPWKYITVSILDRVDLFITPAGSVIPYYYGGVRIEFLPYLNWVSPFLETGVMTYFYQDFDINIESVMFVWNLGISFDLTFPDTIDYMKGLKVKFNKKPETVIIYKTRETQKTIDQIFDAELGDVFAFTNIVFYSDSEKVKPESYKVLDKIADALKKRSDIIFEIGGYTNSIGKPAKEMELSIKRALTVMNYFAKKGIDMYRMKASGYGGLASKNKKVDESNRRVEIKVIDIIK